MTGFTVSGHTTPGQCRGRAHYYLFVTLGPPVISVNSVVQVADYPPGATYGPRTLPNYELLWILSGSARWRTDVYDDAGVRQATVEEDLRPGTVALARRGNRDAYIWYACGPAYALDLIRLARAATALLRTNATIAEIASDCGYSNPYHFSRRFSLAYGQPPGSFRRRRQLTDPLAPVREAGLLPVARRLLEAALSETAVHPLTTLL